MSSSRLAPVVLLVTFALARTGLATTDTLFVPGREDHSPCLATNACGSPVVAWIASAPDTHAAGPFDELVLATRTGGDWGAPEILAGPGDYYTPQVVFAGDGARWVCWARHDGADSQILCRRDLGPASTTFELGDPTQPDLEPSICADDSGGVVVVWQGWRNDDYEILMRAGTVAGFAPEVLVSECANSDREPVVAWGDGRAWIVWSSYLDPPYNLILRTFDGSGLSTAIQLTDSYGARNLHPSIAWDDANGLLWISSLWINRGWPGFNQEEAPGLYDAGSPRVRAFDGTGLFVPAGLDADDRYPMSTMQQLGYDGFDYWGTPMPDRWGSGVEVRPVAGGRVWFFHKQIGAIEELGTANRYWGLCGLRYGGSTWSAPDAFRDLRTSIGWEAPATAASGDSLWVAWTADDRSVPYDTYLNLFGHDLDVVVRGIAVDPTPAGPPTLVPRGAPAPPGPCLGETRPPFTIDDEGTPRTLLFGDNHRHSQDLSWDAFVDPNLKATLFYSLDFLGHDFLVPSDHAERFSKAIWAWVRKWAVIYDVPGRFRAFPGYERAMREGAGGDQNTMYRCVEDFTEASAAYPSVESWHDLYDALAGRDVLAVPHTPAQCGAVTDWPHLAQGDPGDLPAPLRVVEVYQSARESFEYSGCPHQYWGCVAAADEGWVGCALASGLRLGVLAASDHTIRAGFISVFAEDCSRDAIWRALRDRHCFGSSRARKFDCDFRVNGALMGSEISADGPPVVSVHLAGLVPPALIEINRDGDPDWFATPCARAETTFTVLDPDSVVPGTSSYYYLRIRDAAEGMLWTSAVWVDFTSPGVDAPTREAIGPLRLEPGPNPFRTTVRFRIDGLGPDGGRLAIHDVAGRLLRRIDLPPGDAARSVAWDGRDTDGRVAAAGTYFAVVRSKGEIHSTRVVKIR